jgi:hypothetical protein
MKFLTDSLCGLAGRSVQSKDQLWSYRWALYDFRDGIQRHIELNERIFGTLLGNTSVEETMREHKEIQKQADGIIRLADAAESELGQEELNKRALDIREAFTRICELIKAHTAKEDELLKLVQKNL